MKLAETGLAAQALATSVRRNTEAAMIDPRQPPALYAEPMPPGERGRPRLIFPGLMRLYGPLSALAETVMRVVAGGVLVTHGWGKIGDPFGATELAQGLGFHPGELWSLLLAVTEFVGGLCIAIGLLTRFWALAALAVLLVTVYFHWIVQAQGLKGSEYSIVWASIMLFFAIRGSNRHAVDALIGRQL